MPLANVNRKMGFIPYDMGGRSNPIITPRPATAGRTNANAVTNDDISIGDAYTLDTSGNAHRAGTVGTPDTVRGICVGFRLAPFPTVVPGPLSIDYLTAATAGVLLGCEDPNALFSVQADTFAIANIDGTFNQTDAAPDPSFRQSRQSINIGGGAASPNNFRAIDIEPSPADNAYGANARVLVKLLNSPMA